MSDLLALITNLQVGGVGVLEILQALVGFVGAASILGAVIAKFTTNTKDDAFFAKLRDLVLKVSLNVTKK